ncbi:MAG TPA: MFS transporter [Anaerolineae bacterium]|nr:MFS transporter [Anaerolineae bacterium]
MPGRTQSLDSAYQPPAHGWRTFLIVWFTQSISVLGSELTFFALSIWLIQTLYPLPEQKPELALALSLVSLSAAIPRLLLIPFAGAWADRHDRKRTMMSMDLVDGLLSTALAVAVITHTLRLPLLLVLSVLSSIVSVFHQSAFDASYAMIVPESKLSRANGMMQTIWSLTGIVAPGLAAAIIALPALLRQSGATGPVAQLSDGTSLAMTLDAISFFFASTALLFLFIPSPHRADLHDAAGHTQKSMWADVQEGARYIWYRRPMLWLLGTFTVVNLLSSPVGIFQRLLLKYNLAADWTARGMTFESSLALMATIGSVGGLVGGFFISSWGGLKRKRIYGVLVPIIISAAAMIGLGLSAGLIMAACMIFTSSAMVPLMNAHSQTIWQIQTPRELQGRVFAVRRLIAQFTSPLGVAMAGVVGGQLDPGLFIAVLGTILLVFTVVQLFNPYMMRVEDKAWLDAMAAEHEVKHAHPLAQAENTPADVTSVVEDALPEDILHEDVTSVI